MRSRSQSSAAGWLGTGRFTPVAFVCAALSWSPAAIGQLPGGTAGAPGPDAPAAVTAAPGQAGDGISASFGDSRPGGQTFGEAAPPREAFNESARMAAQGDFPSEQALGPIGQAVETLNPLNWNWPTFSPPQLRVPQLLPAREEQQRIVEKKNSLWDDVSGTTRRSWQRTKEALSPQKWNPMNWWTPADPGRPPETRRPAGQESPGFFGSLFRPSEPEARVANVTDFLGQERPNR